MVVLEHDHMEVGSRGFNAWYPSKAFGKGSSSLYQTLDFLNFFHNFVSFFIVFITCIEANSYNSKCMSCNIIDKIISCYY